MKYHVGVAEQSNCQTVWTNFRKIKVPPFIEAITTTADVYKNIRCIILCFLHPYSLYIDHVISLWWHVASANQRARRHQAPGWAAKPSAGNYEVASLREDIITAALSFSFGKLLVTEWTYSLLL